MPADLDMTQYLDLFLQEAEEQLQIFESETLRLEHDPSPERLNVIFRAAHTLKGSARAMGYGDFAGLTHEMENLLDGLRAGSLSFDSGMADLLLRCLDGLCSMRDAIANGESGAMAVDNLLSELRSAQEGQSGSAPNPIVSAPVPAPLLDPQDRQLVEVAAKESRVFSAQIRLREDCLMPCARAMLAMQTASERGELIASAPRPSDLEEENFDQVFTLYLRSEDSAEVLRAAFESISEVERVDVLAYEPKVAAVNAAEADAEVHAPKREANQTVRVDVARLDELMNLVGELVIDRTRISQIGASLAARYDLDEHVEALAETVGHVSRITGELQDILLKARMMPIETVFARLPRAVRDLTHRVGKSISFETSGGETEVDRSVIEALSDPLLHIIRNSVDHGIESPEERAKAGKDAEGKIRVNARHHEGHILIEVTDDGRGIDVARVKAKAVEQGFISRETADRISDKDALSLIYASGLSTASAVSEVSGRGVGMDIVRSNIQALGGLIDVETERGKGSKFTLRLPLTLAIIRGLFVLVEEQTYVLPLMSVLETLMLSDSDVQTIAGRSVMVLRGSTMPLVSLSELLRTASVAPIDGAKDRYVVVVGIAEERVGLVVDRLIGEQEVVIKSLSRFLGDVKGISGATILGNGHVALIADINGLVDMARAWMV
jgi:two-component system chemotaxis sensor kinase CheA